MPTVRVRLYATVRRYAPPGCHEGTFSVELPEGSKLEDLYRRLGIPEREVKQSFVNGRRAEPDQVLREGDEVGVFPPIAGGTEARPCGQP